MGSPSNWTRANSSPTPSPPGSRHSPCITDSITTHCWRCLPLKSTQWVLRTYDFHRLRAHLSRFCQLFAICRPDEQKISGRSSAVLRETLWRRIVHTTNTAAESDHLDSAINSTIDRLPHCGFWRLQSLSSLRFPTTTAKRAKKLKWLLVEIPERSRAYSWL